MSNTNLSIARNSCTDEWIAKTYSEYLNSCATARANLMNKVSDIASDEDIENAIDSVSQDLSEWLTSINDLIFWHIQRGDIGEYQGEDLTTIKVIDDAYIEGFFMTVGADQLNDFYDITGISVSSAYDLYMDYITKYNLDDIAIRSASVQALINNKINSALSELKYNNTTTISLADGYANLRDLIYKVVMNTCTGDSTGSFELDVTDSQNTALSKLNYSVSEFWSDCKANFTSSLAWANGFAAAALNSVSDRVSSFVGNMSTIVSDVSGKISNSVNVVKGLISNATLSLRDFIHNASELLGWSAITTEHKVLSDTDVYAYTGANPLADIDLHTAKGVLSASAKTIAAIGKGIWDGITTMARKAFFKIRPALASVTTNPYDIEEVNKESLSYTVDSWCYTWNDDMLLYDNDNLVPYNDYNSMIQSHLGKWIKFSNIFGEVLFRINSCYAGEKTLYGEVHEGLLLNYDMQVKPRSLDVANALQYLGVDAGNNLWNLFYVNDPANIDYDAIAAMINDFKQSSKMYNEMTNTEEFICIGFILGLDCLTSVINLSVRQLLDAYQSASYKTFTHYVTSTSSSVSIGAYVAAQEDIPSSAADIDVSNYNFLESVSGYNPNSTNPNFKFAHHISCVKIAANQFEIKPTRNTPDLPVFYFPNYVYLIIALWYEKYSSPSDYTYFPYSEENIVFDEPKFRIKTDADNLQASNAFINALVVIAVVAAIVVTIGVAYKVFKAKRLARLSSSVGVLDNKMWSGEKLTLSEALRYQRKSRKISKLSESVTGLTAGKSALDYAKQAAEQIGQNLYSDVTRGENYVSQTDDTVYGAPTVSNKDIINSLYKSITGKTVNSLIDL